MVKSKNKLKIENIIFQFTTKHYLIGLLAVILILIFLAYGRQGLILNSNSIPTPTILFPSPTEIPTATPTPTPTPAPYVDPDPVIDCNITDIGIIKLKRSQCSISFACEIGRGQWYLYTSNDKCIQDQNNYNNQISNGLSTNNNSVNSQKAAINQGVYYSCMNAEKLSYNWCTSSCTGAYNNDSNACNYAYSGGDPKFTECLNEALAAHDNCLTKCNETTQAEYASCISGVLK